MFGLFKLKKKSKKEKNGQSLDDEKENTSSPTKLKKVENGSEKKSPKNASSDTTDSDVKVEKQQKIDITLEKSKDHSNLPSTPSIPRNPKLVKIAKKNGSTQEPGPASTELTVETDLDQNNEAHPSPLSSATTTINIHHQNRAPMLSASDATHTNSFVRGNFLSSTISGSDLHRFLNSGYMNGDPYLQRGVELKTPKSPHFHRPPNFSYSRNGPNYITPQQRYASANRVSASSSDAPRLSRTTLSGITRNRSSSPSHFQQQMHQQSEAQHNEHVEHITRDDGMTTIVTTRTTIKSPVNRDLDTEEPIRLAKYPGGHQPDPEEEPRIESLDWPSPPYPAAVPELRARSRSSSNRRAPSTINSIHGTHISVNGDEQDSDDDDQDLVNDEEVQHVLTNNSYIISHDHNNRVSTGATSVASSLARAKASRPNSKLRYHNNLFDNDYDDYMLRYKSDKDWRKMLNKSTLNRTLESSVGGDSYGDINNNTNELDAEEEEMRKELAEQGKDVLNDSKYDTKRDSDEVKKIKHESGMAAELLGEVEAQQKLLIARKLKVDPWKASRTPSAKAEPSIRTRYESPVNASPSRVYNYHPNRTLSSAISGHTLSPTPVPSQSQTTSATFIGDISLVTNTPVTPMHQMNYTSDANIMSSGRPLTPKSINTSLNRNNYISTSSRVISSSCLPKAGN